MGFQQLINASTRYSRTNTCIDLISSNSKYIMNSGVPDVNISDHQAIFVTRKHSSKIKMKTNFIGRSYIDFDEEIFHEAY